MIDATRVDRAAVLGAGTIGASWAALFLARGMAVAAYDPRPDAAEAIRRMVDGAWPALQTLGLVVEGADPTALTVTDRPEVAVDGARFVQENAPERAAPKRALYAAIDPVLDPAVVVASSTSGIPMSTLQPGLAHPGRFAVGHPFNPPHLIPLVEVVGGAGTAPETLDWLMAFYAHIGKVPVRLSKEVPGHLVNRLQAALWGEAIQAVVFGVASVADVDRAIAHGPGLRWAVMGPHMLFHLAGGPGGMGHFADHIGEAMKTWWADMSPPTLDAATRQALIDGVTAEAEGRSVADLAAARDATLLRVLQAVRAQDAGHDRD